MNNLPNSSTEVTKFWDQAYHKNKTKFPQNSDPMLLAAMEHFGNIEGKLLLDLGCGDGRSSLFFAKFGAKVVAIDISSVAIENLIKFCQVNEIGNIRPVQASPLDIEQLGQFDFVFGSMILHHLEPFNLFAEKLRKAVKPDGKAFFYENSAMSSLLVWCRDNLVGKYGIPKGGDDEEFPLTPQEIEQLRQYFSVEIVYPDLLFFRLISQYLLKHRLFSLTQWLDRYFFKFPKFRKYSYRQNLLLF